MADNDKRLELSRVFKATADKLFDIWTKAELMREWMIPNKDEYTVFEASSDPKVGGGFRVGMQWEDQRYVAFGEYKEIDRPHRLVYSWAWEGMDEDEITEVTVTFNEVDEGTEVKIVHEGFNTKKSAEKHMGGWVGCLDNVEHLI